MIDRSSLSSSLISFEQAIGQFKMNDNWAEAAEACYRCAEVYEKTKDTLEAANKYADSGLCIARVDPKGNIRLKKEKNKAI